MTNPELGVALLSSSGASAQLPVLAQLGGPWWRQPGQMLDEDELIQRYDDIHGGLARARAAAEAIQNLLPATDRLFVTTADKQAADDIATGHRSERNWTSDTCALLASASQQVGLQLAGAATLRGHGHPDRVATESIYPVLAFRRRMPA